MTNESTGSPDAGQGLPTVDEVIDSARDLSGVERPVLPPDPAMAAASLAPTGASAGVSMADSGHGSVAASRHANGLASGHDASSGHGTASGNGSGAPDSHAGGHDDAHDVHGAHDPRDTNLGPPDLASWSAGIVGVAIALVVAFCFALASGVVAS